MPKLGAVRVEIMNGDPDSSAICNGRSAIPSRATYESMCSFSVTEAGANGKSVFLETLLGMLGEYARPINSEILMAKFGESHPTGIASLFGARLVTAVEIEEGRRWAESTVKGLTGGDRISARRMREDFWTFNPTHKLWIAGNHKPDVRGTDDGIWRRFHMIPFPVSFKGRENKGLPEKLRDEFPGILNWAVHGCLVWQRQGLFPPPAVTRATEEYREEQDMLGAFIAERCERGEGFEVSRSALRRAYEPWCREYGAYPLPARQFNSALRERGFAEIKSKKWQGSQNAEQGWRGLRVASSTPLPN